MKVIRYEDVESFVEARDRVVQAAMAVVDRYNEPNVDVHSDALKDQETMDALEAAVVALRCLNADRGVRDPSTPGEQATNPEQAHGEDRNG